MEVTTVTYRRVSNLGNYETEALEVEAIVDEFEEPAEVVAQLRAFVDDQLEASGLAGRYRRATPRPQPDSEARP